MALIRNDARMIGPKFSMSTIQIPTRLRYDHYLDLMPCGWNIASSQAYTKISDNVRDKNHPSLL
jgi:hypothetical protein